MIKRSCTSGIQLVSVSKYGKSLMILAINQLLLTATYGLDEERKMNLLTVPAQAVPTPSRKISPIPCNHEHKRAVNVKVRLIFGVRRKRKSSHQSAHFRKSTCRATRRIKANGHFHHAKKSRGGSSKGNLSSRLMSRGQIDCLSRNRNRLKNPGIS